MSMTGTAARMPSLTGSSFNATLDDLSRVFLGETSNLFIDALDDVGLGHRSPFLHGACLVLGGNGLPKGFEGYFSTGETSS